MDKKGLAQSQIYTSKDVLKGFAGKCSNQHNFSDCGLYVMHFAEKFLDDPDTILPFLIKVRTSLMASRGLQTIAKYDSQDKQPDWLGNTKKPVNDRERQAITDRIWDLDGAKERRVELYKEISRAATVWVAQRRLDMIAKDSKRAERRLKAQEQAEQSGTDGITKCPPGHMETDDSETDSGTAASDVEFVGEKKPKTPSPMKRRRSKKKIIAASSDDSEGPEVRASMRQRKSIVQARPSPSTSRAASPRRTVEVEVCLPSPKAVPRPSTSHGLKAFRPLFDPKQPDNTVETFPPGLAETANTLPQGQLHSEPLQLNSQASDPPKQERPLTMVISQTPPDSPVDQMHSMSLNCADKDVTRKGSRSNDYIGIGKQTHPAENLAGKALLRHSHSEFRLSQLPAPVNKFELSDSPDASLDLSISDSFVCQRIPVLDQDELAASLHGDANDIANIRSDVRFYAAAPPEPLRFGSPSLNEGSFRLHSVSPRTRSTNLFGKTSLLESQSPSAMFWINPERKRTRAVSSEADSGGDVQYELRDRKSKKSRLHPATSSPAIYRSDSAGIDPTSAISIGNSDNEIDNSQGKHPKRKRAGRRFKKGQQDREPEDHASEREEPKRA